MLQVLQSPAAASRGFMAPARGTDGPYLQMHMHRNEAVRIDPTAGYVRMPEYGFENMQVVVDSLAAATKRYSRQYMKTPTETL